MHKVPPISTIDLTMQMTDHGCVGPSRAPPTCKVHLMLTIRIIKNLDGRRHYPTQLPPPYGVETNKPDQRSPGRRPNNTHRRLGPGGQYSDGTPMRPSRIFLYFAEYSIFPLVFAGQLGGGGGDPLNIFFFSPEKE